MALPNLTDAERQAALKKAAEARQKRAALRAQIKAGEKSFAQVMAKSDDPIVARMKVSTLLESLPGYGKAKAGKIMEELEISESRRVQGLGARQREALVAQFGSLITREYSAAIDAYDGHETQVDPVRLAPGDDDVIVRSRFKKAGAQPIEVNYVMRTSVQGWKVYDIVVENMSLVITSRSQFGEEVTRGGIDGLIRTLVEKNRAPTR